MSLPFFYTETLNTAEQNILLSEENSKHIVQVLRMKEGEQLRLTDGKGMIYTAEITDAHKKKCTVRILQEEKIAARVNKICIAVSPLKNNSRFEWFLEKATEIGVTTIVPIVCDRTEQHHFRFERMQGILVSAMLQSQQAWLPVLAEPVKVKKYIALLSESEGRKYIAHCEEEGKNSLKHLMAQPSSDLTNSSTILIGPEGDFTPEEIQLALQNNFTAVSLGDTRLRTETAALVAATLLCIT